MSSIVQKHIIGIVSLVFVISALSAILFTTHPSYASVSGWKAGNIISDSVFTDKTTMSAANIQAFLNSKVPSCDTWGTQTSEYGGGTRRQWAESRGYSAPFTCLRNYSQGGKSAAQIIYNAAQKYTINPQVLIVLLQKEQGLVTDTWPLSIQYRAATGYGCPDTADCDSDYYGFTNQVDQAAHMFRAILNDSPTWYTPYELGNNHIQYSPTASCGGSTVYIQNRATQALYNYTPYQPNQAALDAGWGTVSCGAYGNRNFYLYFTSWFGSTAERYTSLHPPRWMQLARDTQKTDLWTSSVVGSVLAKDRQVLFSDKLTVDGQLHIRTAADRADNIHRGIISTDVIEIPYAVLSTPKWMQLSHDTHKRDPRTGGGVDGTLNDGRDVQVSSSITVNDITYLRTSGDTNGLKNKAIALTALEEIPYVSFSDPRWMRVNSSTTKIDPRTGQSTVSTLSMGDHVKFTSKIQIAGVWYYRSEADTNSNTSAAIPASSVERIAYTSITGGERTMRLKNTTHKVRPQSGEALESISSGRLITFSQQVTINGLTYYRTKADMLFGHDKAIPATDVENIK